MVQARPGARFREGDIVVSTGTGHVQVELVAGGNFDLAAPATLYAAAVPVTGEKLTGLVDMSLPEGWLKLAANAPPAGFRVQMGALAMGAVEAIIVMHAQPGTIELFVESGAAKVTEAGAGGGKVPCCQ